jgi:aspartyl-tRNA(Asn)/glutamyl-tRNA(Gln) amidotransferase subunit C
VSSITIEDVKAIAELSKLDIREEDLPLYVEQFRSVLGYFAKLNELDTSNVPPTASVLPLRNVLRADVPAQPLHPEQVTLNALDAEFNQFRVNAVLDQS